jgi:hypothetical protein
MCMRTQLLTQHHLALGALEAPSARVLHEVLVPVGALYFFGFAMGGAGRRAGLFLLVFVFVLILVVVLRGAARQARRSSLARSGSHGGWRWRRCRLGLLLGLGGGGSSSAGPVACSLRLARRLDSLAPLVELGALQRLRPRRSARAARTGSDTPPHTFFANTSMALSSERTCTGSPGMAVRHSGHSGGLCPTLPARKHARA